MNPSKSTALTGFGILGLCLAVLAGNPDPIRADTVSLRLGTGLRSSGNGDGLPEAWVPPVERAPRIDGRLDDPVWSSARPLVLGALTRRGPVAPGSEARFIRQGGYLYAGLKLTEPNIKTLRRSVRDPDGPAYRDDSVEIFLSPFPAQGYFQFIISATGAVYDRRNRDNPAEFNAGARSAAAVEGNGWSVEVAIPLTSLDVGKEVPSCWRANIYRNRWAGGEGENQAWSPTFRGDYDVPERFGRLHFTPTSPWARGEKRARRQRGIEMEDLPGGGTVLRFDLSAIPRGARIHRARLRCRRRAVDPGETGPPGPAELYPLEAPYRAGETPAPDARPLALVPPWYNSFDMTELVAAWVSGARPHHGLLVKDFPGWRRETTYLDVLLEGKAGRVPPQVKDLAVFHRSGQTFITWKEISDPLGRDRIRWGDMKAILDGLDREEEIRYCVYRSLSPITRESLHRAELIAQVPPLSAWNIQGRNIARPIDEFIATAEVLNWHQWNPFGHATMDGDYGRDCPIDRFVITAGEPPLSRGRGLYVHGATEDGSAYYAVVTRADGVENTRDLGPENTTTLPVAEKVGDPEPVLQGELPRMPFFNYKQRRLHFVRWVAPPFSNRPYDYYNWSVGVPDGMQEGAPLELNLHRDGYAYWRTHYRIEPGSIVLCPHDFPRKSWWYGYHEALGTLRPWKKGIIRNYTEKRLLWFTDWAARRWRADWNRITITGLNGGASGSGALHLGLRHPRIFNLVIAGHGEPDYRGMEELEKIWGRPGWAVRTESGRSVWEELDLIRHVRSLPPSRELPFVSMTYSDRQKRAGELARVLEELGHPVITHTAWGGQRLVPVSAAATYRAVPLDIRKNRCLLAVSSRGKAGDRVHNASITWSSAEIADEPDSLGITFHQGPGNFEGTITLRRLQKFRVKPGSTCIWKLDPLEVPGGRGRAGGGATEARSGRITADSDGLLQFTNLQLAPGTYRLTLTALREDSP